MYPDLRQKIEIEAQKEKAKTPRRFPSHAKDHLFIVVEMIGSKDGSPDITIQHAEEMNKSPRAACTRLPAEQAPTTGKSKR